MVGSDKSAPAGQSWLLVAAGMASLGWGGNQFIPLMVMYREVARFSQLEVDLFSPCM